MNYNRALGVCMPVYKRPDQLRRCALSVIAAAEPHGAPLFIVDDAVDETNREVIAQLSARYPYVIYSKNERNLGIDRNIVRAIDLCDCDFAWPLGEDDQMTPDAIGTVLDALAKDAPPAFLYANYASMDETVTTILKERSLLLTSDCRMAAADFLRQYAWSIGFIGACVINKALWSQVDSARYIGTYYAHVGTIMESIQGREAQLLAKPLVLNRCGNASVFTWSDDSDGVFSGWTEAMRRLQPLYGEEVCAAAAGAFEEAHGLNTLKFLCGRRADSLYDLAAYRARIRPMRRSPLYKSAAWLIAVGRPRLFQGMRGLFQHFRKRQGRALSQWEMTARPDGP